MLLEVGSLQLVRSCYGLVGVLDLGRSGMRGRVDWSFGDGQVQDGYLDQSCLLIWLPEWSLVVGMNSD